MNQQKLTFTPTPKFTVRDYVDRECHDMIHYQKHKIFTHWGDFTWFLVLYGFIKLKPSLQKKLIDDMNKAKEKYGTKTDLTRYVQILCAITHNA